MSYILDYAEQIDTTYTNNNKILVSDYVKKMYDVIAENIVNPKQYHLNEELAKRHINFIQKFCRTSDGVFGAPLVLEPFQLAFLEATFGMVDDNDIRQYKEVNFICGRKNGKTTLLSSVALDLLCNDREGSPKIYFIATKIDQAKIGFEECCNMREQSPLLSKHTRKRAFDIYFPKNFGSIKPIASDVKKLDGLNPHAVIIDELGAITKRTVYDDMKQSMYARRQPLLFCISTNNWVRQGVYDAQVTYGKKMLDGKLEDNRFLFLYYALNDKSQIKDEKYWIIANPGIGVIKNTDELRASVNKAKHDPGYLPTLCVKDFNLDENPTTAWLTNDAAVNTEEVSLEYLENSYAVGGCDLSSTYDLTCASLLIKKPDDKKTYVLQHYFLPQKRIDEIREQEEPEAPYELWAEQGYLTISPGAQVSFHQVTEWFVKMVEEHDIRPLWIGYDRALAGYWVEDMESYGFEMEKIAQGAKTWTYPMKQLKAELMDHTLVYQNNPMTYWCLINTGVDSQNEDGIESQRPIKIQKHRRIDGTVSMLNAYTAYLENQAEYEGYIK